jgi:hypothetical protein
LPQRIGHRAFVLVKFVAQLFAQCIIRVFQGGV